MRMSFIFAILLSVTCACRSENPIVDPDIFSGLPEGDTLELKFTSHGCFHYYSYELVFEHSSGHTVSIFEVCDVYDSHISDRAEIGRLRLTPSDLEGLDNLARFYRLKLDGACTTTETIAISRRRAGAIGTTERFVDKTCATDHNVVEMEREMGMERKTGVGRMTTVHDLVKRLH